MMERAAMGRVVSLGAGPLVVIALCGCGGDKGGESQVPDLESYSCAIEVEFTGDLSHQLQLEEFGCAYTSGGDSGVFTSLYPVDGVVSSLFIRIDDIQKGELGVFSAHLTILTDDDRTFNATDCTVEVTHHIEDSDGDDAFGVAYRLGGMGSCASPALAVESNDEFLVSDFRFSITTSWPE